MSEYNAMKAGQYNDNFTYDSVITPEVAAAAHRVIEAAALDPGDCHDLLSAVGLEDQP
jgi:hypothetical protein